MSRFQRYPVMGAHNTAWRENVCFCREVNFLADSVPGGRKLHLKFHFYRGDTPDRTPTA